MTFDDNSGITTSVLGGEGAGGDIKINTHTLEVKNDSRLLAELNEGTGRAGNVSINAPGSVTVIGSSDAPTPEDIAGERDTTLDDETGIFTTIEGGTVVQNEEDITGGNITIETGILTVRNGARILAENNGGTGEAGSIAIDADTVTITEFVGNRGATVGAEITNGGNGTGGNITIDTGTLTVSDGARILARNRGSIGDAGSITIDATGTVTIAGYEENRDAIVGTDVASRIDRGELVQGIGNGNDLKIKARSININNNAIVAASIINGQGRDEDGAGDITLEASERVDITNNSVVFSEIGSGSVGNGGTIDISAPVISIDGSSVNTQIRGPREDLNLPAGQGKAGDIIISAPQLLQVSNGGQLATITRGIGDAGNITIEDSQNVIFEGEGENRWDFIRDNSNNSGAFTSVESTARGNAGIIAINNVGSLSLNDGARLSARTEGQGIAGDININANTLEANLGSQILTDTTTGSNAGDINLTFSNNVSLTGEKYGTICYNKRRRTSRKHYAHRPSPHPL